METPPPARSPRRLTIKGGFRADGGQHHQLDQQARRLGFADLRSCLQALLEDSWSIPQLATHLGSTQAAIRRAIVDHHIHQPSRRELLARQRQRAAQQRAATRVAELGFQSVRAYLVDRLAAQAWTLAAVAAELGAARSTLRRLRDQHQVRRVAPTRRQRAAAAAASGPHKELRAGQQRRQARLASSASPRWRSTCEIDMSAKAGRCGGCAPNSGSAMAGWMGSWPGSGYDPDPGSAGLPWGLDLVVGHQLFGIPAALPDGGALSRRDSERSAPWRRLDSAVKRTLTPSRSPAKAKCDTVLTTI